MVVVEDGHRFVRVIPAQVPRKTAAEGGGGSGGGGSGGGRAAASPSKQRPTGGSGGGCKASASHRVIVCHVYRTRGAPTPMGCLDPASDSFDPLADLHRAAACAYGPSFAESIALLRPLEMLYCVLTLLAVGSEVSDSLACDQLMLLALYLASGWAGGYCAATLSDAATVGASGAVSGVIVALSVLRPRSAVHILGDVDASHPLLLLLGTLGADLTRGSGISWQAHFGGGAVGGMLAWLLSMV